MGKGEMKRGVGLAFDPDVLCLEESGLGLVSWTNPILSKVHCHFLLIRLVLDRQLCQVIITRDKCKIQRGCLMAVCQRD